MGKFEVQNVDSVFRFTRLSFHDGELLQRRVHDADRKALLAVRLCQPTGVSISFLLALHFHLLLYRREPVGEKLGFVVALGFRIAAGHGRDIQVEVPLARASSVVHRDGGRFLERAPNPRERRRLRIEHHEHSVAEGEGLVERALPRVASDIFAELVLVVRVRAHMPHANAHAHALIQGHFRELGLGWMNTDRMQTKQLEVRPVFFKNEMHTFAPLYTPTIRICGRHFLFVKIFPDFVDL